MRVLLANKFYHRRGGAEVYLFDIMAILQEHGHEVVPFSMRHELNVASDYESFFVDNADYDQPGSWMANLRKASRILYSRQARQKITALIDHTHPNLAHVHNIYHQISPSILPVLKRKGLPVIMTLHDLKLLCPNYKMRTQGAVCERCKPNRFYQAILHRCVRNSLPASALCAAESYLHRYSGVYESNVDMYITPSQFYRRKMIEWGMPENKLVCVPTFTDVQQYRPFYTGDGYLIYLGRLAEEKGLLTLVDAMLRVPQGKLYIIGEGPLYGILQKRIGEYKLQNVHLTGPKWNEELEHLISGARFTVVPSEWYENSPNSLARSYAHGKPVLGANIGGIPEMIEEGRTGLLFEPGSAEDLAAKIRYLLSHEGLAVEMGKNARVKAEQEYSPQAHYSKLIAVYSKMNGKLNGRPAGEP